MDEDRDIRTDKTIVIGLTGPIASGCTTLSKFLAEIPYEEYMGIVDYLNRNGYLDESDKSRINQNVFDEHLEKLFANKLELEGAIEQGNHQQERIGEDIKNLDRNTIENRLRDLHNEIKQVLEKREYTYSLEYLLDDKYYKNRLRISCSSIIVFDVLLNLAKGIRPQSENVGKDKWNKVSRFLSIFDQVIRDHEFDLKLLSNVYETVYKFFHHDEWKEGLFEKDETNRLKSDKVNRCFDCVQSLKKVLSEEYDYRELMQDFGDNIRATGNPFFYPKPGWFRGRDNIRRFRKCNVRIARIIDYIIHFYVNSDKEINLFLIDCFRNPQCVEYLRKRYPRFFLISVFASASERKRRLTIKLSRQQNETFRQREFEKIFLSQDARDKGDISKERPYEQFYKQNVDATVRIADIAINNDDVSKEALFGKTMRYLALIFDPGCTKPTGDEMFMNMAYTMAMKSNCISRQVGAVIEGKDGYVVGAGWNDVGAGQISCGLRNIKDLRLAQYAPLANALVQKSPNMSLGKRELIEILEKEYGGDNYCFCFKDDISKFIVHKKLNKVFDSIETYNDCNNDNSAVRECVEVIRRQIEDKLNVKNLQYCKALHAEENAIIQASKIGGMGLAGGRIYATTFPCELCAKKIQQVGLKEVVYVEPYPDNISEKIYLQDGVLKVKTRQFEGVKGYAYFKLFKPFLDEKDWQYLEHRGFVE